MGFETSAFGGQTNVTDEVSNHFGARPTGGAHGALQSAGASREVIVAFADDQPLHTDVYIPVGAVVKDYAEFGSATGTVVTVGGADVTDASIGDDLTDVIVGNDGKVVFSSTAGRGRGIITYVYTNV